MKRIYITFSFIISSLAFSQVGINIETPKVSLDIKAKRDVNGTIADDNQLYGFQPPRISLEELTDNTFVYGNDQKGALIYITDASGGMASGQRENITEEGLYYFNGTVWKKMIMSNSNEVKISTIVDPNILGYTPSPTATASSAGIPTIASRTLTKSGTVTYNGNGHSYAIYLANNTITWYQAYEAAKQLGGYLATFTTDAEWEYVETSLVTSNTQFNNYGGWIGFAKFSWNGGSALVPSPEMKWITGEQPNHNYLTGGTSAVAKSHWFTSDEPNNSGGGEGFVHFRRRGEGITKTVNGYRSTHPWNDVSANNTRQGVRGFIVEFQQ